MIIVMKKGAEQKEIDDVTRWIESVGYRAHLSEGVERTIIGAVGDERGKVFLKSAEMMPGVEKVVPILQPYKLASRESREGDTIINVGNVAIGGPKFVVIAGPCAVETEEQLMESAYVVKKAGASMLRGGAFKPRTSPYSFQGLGEEGLKILARAREKTGLPVVTEVMSASDVELVESYVDVLQVGARNTQNFALLKGVGHSKKPVLLKRGMMTTIEELLMSAEYILASGNDRVMLCERGIRSFETATRNTLDLSAVPVLKEKTHLPVIVDPSHAVG
ncbi:MAG: 3-deoxy-7-phosphoheptulonate synthase, partial [Thermoplasmata archaeon]